MSRSFLAGSLSVVKIRVEAAQKLATKSRLPDLGFDKLTGKARPQIGSIIDFLQVHFLNYIAIIEFGFCQNFCIRKLINHSNTTWLKQYRAIQCFISAYSCTISLYFLLPWKWQSCVGIPRKQNSALTLLFNVFILPNGLCQNLVSIEYVLQPQLFIAHSRKIVHTGSKAAVNC